MQWAQRINVLSGGAVIAPWQVEQLNDEWLEVFGGLNSLAKRREAYLAFERRLEERRRSNPTYRKYLT